MLQDPPLPPNNRLDRDLTPFPITRCVNRGITNQMIRIREIMDPDLKRLVLDALAERRGCSVASIPEWFELDDADYVDLLNDLKEAEEGPLNDHDYRE